MRARSLTLLALLLLASSLALPLAPAHAASRVGVANDQGSAAIDPTFETSLRLTGSGFQSVRGGFGGIYVLFGTVSGSWRPSAGGGGSTLYAPDSQTAGNAGYQRFVAFPGSDTAAEANGGTIRGDGTWSTTLKVPGARFRAVDADGRVRSVDCRKVTCGVITFGAHGVANRVNETFTPVRVQSLYADGEAPAASADPSATAAPQESATSGGAGSAGTSTPSASASPGARGRQAAAAATAPALEVDRASAVAGRVLAFTGSGLPAGRQVSVVLDDGAAGAGPLTVAVDGTLAGVLQLPGDVEPGTHELRVVGAGSEEEVAVRFAVADDSETLAAAVGWQPRAFVAAAALVLVVALGVVVRRVWRRRRA